jgi:hypothetical protein
MKKLLLFGLAFVISLGAVAQTAKLKKGLPVQNLKVQKALVNEPAPAATIAPVKPSPVGVKGGDNTNAVQVLDIGTSSNGYGYYTSSRTMLWADDDMNVIINFHRMGPGTTTGISGFLGYDLGINMGATTGDWTNQIQIMDSKLAATPYYYDAGRYPSAGIYNPLGNTTLANAYVAYYAPNFANTVVSGFGGNCYGVGNLVDHADTTKHMKWYAPPPYTYIPDGFTITQDGLAFCTQNDENVESGSVVYQDHVILGSGVWNDGTKDFDYSWQTLDFPCVDSYTSANVKVAASPDGQIIWISALTNLPGSTHLSDSSYFPVVRKSNNGGESWSEPYSIQLDGVEGLDGIKNAYSDAFIEANFGAGVDRATIPYTTAFDHSISVDKWGNLHIGVAVGYSPGGYSISTGIDSLINVFDIYTTDDGVTWNAVKLGALKTLRGTWGDFSSDNRVYVARDKAGEKMFFTYNDTRVDGETNNQNPNVLARGFDLLTNKITVDAEGDDEPNNVTWLSDIMNEAYVQCTSPLVFTDNNKYTIPIAVQWYTDPATPVQFKYIPDFSYVDADFTISVNNPPFPVGVEQKEALANVTINPNPVKDVAKVTVNLKKDANVTVKVTNMLGQQVMSMNKGNMTSGSQQFILDASSLNSGVYFVTVLVNGEKYTQKMIVE